MKIKNLVLDTDNELAECAKINFENFAEACPLASQHPYFKVAKMQLDEALGYKTQISGNEEENVDGKSNS